MLSCKYDFFGSFRSPASLKMIISQFDLIRDWMIDVKPNNVIYLGNRLSGTYFPMKSFAYELRRELPVKFTFHSRSCGWEKVWINLPPHHSQDTVGSAAGWKMIGMGPSGCLGNGWTSWEWKGAHWGGELALQSFHRTIRITQPESEHKL